MSVFAVNGKEPIAAWIPSLDTAGNGTLELFDLVGSNDCDLVNMTTGDWVSDTDAGGVWALDFDGANDHGETKANFPKIAYSGGGSFCAWVKPDTIAGGTTFSATNPRYIFASTPVSVNDANALFRLLGGYIDFTFRNSATANFCTCRSDSAVISASSWQHVAAVHTGSAIVLYHQGSAVASTTTNYSNSARTTASIAQIGGEPFGQRYFDGLIDDIRIFDQALDATDIAFLYKSGFGRGVTKKLDSRRRRYAGGYGL